MDRTDYEKMQMLNEEREVPHTIAREEDECYFPRNCEKLSRRVPILYRLPKVHQQDVPLSPIVSFVTSPTYQLSKLLTGILAPLVV